GLSWGFQRLPENRELLIWLREHNAHATKKVHLYGLDLTGGDDVGVWPGASKAVIATLDYAKRFAPTAAASLRSNLGPLMDRFIPDRYPEYSAEERDELRDALNDLYQLVLDDTSGMAGARSRLLHVRGLRNAWAAQRLNEIMAISEQDGLAGA